MKNGAYAISGRPPLSRETKDIMLDLSDLLYGPSLA